MKVHEKLAHHLHDNCLEAGCDEAGRGCLAGPVFAATVILPEGFECAELNDSKKLTEKQRERLRLMIEQESMSFAVAACTPEEIDEMNILWASVESMHRALNQLSIIPDHILVDGNRFKKYKTIPHTCIIKGDAKFMSIAAASILAKTYRDDYMKRMDNLYPAYDWKNNKGYPTRSHRHAIEKHGVTPLHRKSFRLLENQLQIQWDK